MSKITTALQKAEMQRFRTASPLKIYAANPATNPLDETDGQERSAFPARITFIAFLVAFLAVFALIASAFTLVRLDEQKQFAFELQMTSEAQAAQIRKMAAVQQVQKEDLVISYNHIEQLAADSHNKYTQIISENNHLKETVGNLSRKLSLLSAEVSTLKSDNIILTNDQEALHQKLLALREKVQDIKNTALTHSSTGGHVPVVRVPGNNTDSITPQEGI